VASGKKKTASPMENRTSPPKPRGSIAKSVEEAFTDPQQCEEHVFFSTSAGLQVTVRQRRVVKTQDEFGNDLTNVIPPIDITFGHDGFFKTTDAEVAWWMLYAKKHHPILNYHLDSVGGAPMSEEPATALDRGPKYTSGAASTGDASAAMRPDV